MKNKKAIYILLPAVLAIWALIAYKIFGGSTTSTPPPRYSDTIKANGESALQADTFSLFGSYNDPFLGEVKAAKPATKAVAVNKQTVKPVALVKTAWPAVTYSGMVRNQKSDKQLVMLQVNGSSNVMKAGDESEGIVLLTIWKDSVQLQMGKEKKIVKK